jgi:NAD(P)H dehydrogenase (quinone)
MTMKIGIIVHSKTGHTLSVADKLYERFLAAGHTISIEKVTASNDRESNVDSIILTNAPKLDGFDMIVFGAPVRGYMLSPVMQAYLHQLPSLKGKIITGFVTQFFPKPTMGGNQAIKNLDEICRSKGAGITKSGIINWVNPVKRKKLIEETVDIISINLGTGIC